MSLSQRSVSAIWHPYTQMKTAPPPIPIVRGDGVYLYDDRGRKYLDAISSWWVTLHGHAHPHIAEAVSRQVQQLEHVIFAGFTHPVAIELAERLLNILPGNQGKIFFSDDGSTAVEVALKMCMQYWHNLGEKRGTIIALQGAYHGDTMGAMSVGERGAFTTAFEPYLFNTQFIDLPCVDDPLASRNQLLTIIENHNTAAFIFEPLIQGVAGMRIYDATLLDELIRLCKEHDVLTIADEVLTGFGRTGRFFASDYLSEKPDIICLSKGLTGGTMALGVTSCTNGIYEAFLSVDRSKTFFHGHSFTANPIACAAAVASLDLLESESCQGRIEAIHGQHQAFAERILRHERVRAARVLGTIVALEVGHAAANYFDPLGPTLYERFIKRGILLRPLGNILYVLPPYCITAQELELVYDAITEVLDNIESRNCKSQEHVDALCE